MACLTLPICRRLVIRGPSCCKPLDDGVGIAAVAVIAAVFVAVKIGPRYRISRMTGAGDAGRGDGKRISHLTGAKDGHRSAGS